MHGFGVMVEKGKWTYGFYEDNKCKNEISKG